MNLSRAWTLKYRLCLLSPVFPHLVKELNTGLHVTILLLLFLALALALVSMGFAILNMIQVPYKAVNGPGGICLWNVLAGKEAPGRELHVLAIMRLSSKKLEERCEGINTPTSAFTPLSP